MVQLTSFRLATVKDANDLTVLAERTFRDTYSSQNSQEEVDLYCRNHFSAMIQKEELLDPNVITLVAKDTKHQLIAYAQIHLNSVNSSVKSERPSELNRIYIASQHHGKGLAQELLQLVFKTLRSKNRDLVWLGVWENNFRALSFYKKNGFVEIGEHEFLFGSEVQRDLVLAIDL